MALKPPVPLPTPELRPAQEGPAGWELHAAKPRCSSEAGTGLFRAMPRERASVGAAGRDRPTLYWVMRYLAEKKEVVARSTYLTYRRMLTKLPKSALLNHPNTIRRVEIDALLMAAAVQGFSVENIDRMRWTLSTFFDWLVSNQGIDLNPVRRTPLPITVPVKEINPYTEEELNRAWQCWESHDRELAQVAMLLAKTGLRWSEACELRVKDYENSPNPIITVSRRTGKDGKAYPLQGRASRRVWVTADVARYLRPLAAGKSADELLLPPLERSLFLRRLNWDKTSGGRTIEDLRDTYATLMLAQGIGIEIVSTWLGSSDRSRTARRYARWGGATANRAAINSLDLRLSPPGKA